MKNISNFLFLLILAINFGGCSGVHVHVNSINHIEGLSKKVPLVFPKESQAIEKEKLRRECVIGAKESGMKVLDNCNSGECYFIFVTGKVGSTSERTYTEQNNQTKQIDVSSYSITQRMIDIKIFEDSNKKKLIYESQLNSEGEASNVLSVAKEMCQAAFIDFPRELTGEFYKIKK